MKTAGKIFAVIAGTVISLNVAAQTDSTQETNTVKFKLGVYYNTDLNYYGRTDSLRSSGFFPIAELWFSNNLYINAAPVFVNNKIQSFQYAGTVATLGYRFNSNNKFAGHLYVVKPFYKSSSELVQSALKAQAAANFTLLNKVVNLNAGGDVKFSDRTDFGLNGGLDHIFRIQLTNNKVLVIEPSAYIYAGTQQFTSSYLAKNGGFLLLPGNEQLVSESSGKFNVLSYEFSVPVVLGIDKFQLLLTPAYVLPQNLVAVPGRPDLSERGKDMLYATIGAKVNF